MQGLTDPPRNDLTEVQVIGLIRDVPSVVVGAGLELIDQSLTVLADISDALLVGGSSVSRAGLATLHGTARLQIATDLDWGQALVRPYLTLSDGQTAARFDQGAYYTSTPGRPAGASPPVFDVAGYDILHGLYTPVGEAYAIDTGTSYLVEVAEILTTLGYTALIDQSAVSAVLPAPRLWPIDENNRWLTIINDLLAAVGYAGIWSDWSGRMRCERYISPLDRAAEWTYDLDPERSLVAPDRTIELDYFEAPNRWVAIRSNAIDGPAPVEGNGMVTYVNEGVGPTSREARGGRIITRIMHLEAADHAALVARAQQTIDADIRTTAVVRTATSPNPLHWHFDRLHVDDPELGVPMEALSRRWTLPLDGGLMTHEWAVLQ